MTALQLKLLLTMGKKILILAALALITRCKTALLVILRAGSINNAGLIIHFHP